MNDLQNIMDAEDRLIFWRIAVGKAVDLLEHLRTQKCAPGIQRDAADLADWIAAMHKHAATNYWNQ